MLLSDGPYAGTIEGAKEQLSDIEDLIAENQRKKNDHPSALPTDRNISILQE